ncbi:MAG TPA: Ig-like domain-containing protein, partial [Mycobacteriales bacterium]|nr:Ig-like domain-containing protein [Mycobacteriales bacterium]
PASPHGTTEKLTFTATVTGVTGIKPTGSVTIHDGRGDTCTGNLRSAGTAKCSFSEKKGLRNITAHYNGDSNYTTVAKTKKVVVKG